jgi:hypothetical protein
MMHTVSAKSTPIEEMRKPEAAKAIARSGMFESVPCNA